MFKVYADNNLIYTPVAIDQLRILSGKINLELNKLGDFTFVIPPSNPYYSRLKRFKTIISVFQNKRLIFKGRILDDEQTFNLCKRIKCEGVLAYLLDTTVRPFQFNGSPAELFTYLINQHNEQVEESKRFKVGRITVTDPNDYIQRSDSEYTKTLELIKSQLIDTNGGYLWIRHEEDGMYIDYLEDFDTINTQTIEFGKNMLDMSRVTKGSEIATAVIPLGARIIVGEGDNAHEERLTIKEINNGNDFVFDQEAVDQYGWISRPVVFDNVNVDVNLKRKGEEYLSIVKKLIVSLKLNALDLGNLKKEIGFFAFGSYVKVKSKPHDIDQNLLIEKMGIDLFRPSENTVNLGITISSFLDNQLDTNAGMGTVIDRVDKIEKDYITNIVKLQNNVSSLIKQESDKIMLQVRDELKTETDKIIEMQQTILEQTKESFNFIFQGLRQDIDSNNEETLQKFEEWKKYIRFIDGNIELGERGNPLILTLRHDRIFFSQNGLDKMVLTDGKIIITDGEFTNSCQTGNFAWLPRKTGNLQFKKVR